MFNLILVDGRFLYKSRHQMLCIRSLIDKIIAGVKKKIGVSITYADFDHMVWYYFKGSKSKIISAMEHLPDKN